MTEKTRLNLDWLLDRYGALMHAHDIEKALRYPSAAAFRMARMRGKIELPMFPLPGRRGLFAHTEDVAVTITRLFPSEEKSTM